ncbi:YbaB/EbfC family nucleoid-associated protein [Nonomuraea sp. MG754425]|uniref:YbaB/EbfC family nucleoid-associated protein n=1 Tax=Nonomuraea sp. MG754425 TaxID=2570319 RepID=UPI001F1C2D57|nr:YbaB/EbfC family nucleoid-associated protein [Nonomuraea sp. MG754425]MCF6468990.1 YbaB/EbfC family nucleoid-associated protein [Nonomuraea sp. MG754425]
MSEEFRTAIEDMAKEYNQQAVRLRAAYGKLVELTATAESADRMITVTVGPRGQVQRIDLDPRVYRRLSPSQLSRAILEQIGAATSDVAEQTEQLMRPFVPKGLPFDQLYGDGASFESFLPQPVRLPGEDARGQ